MCNSLSLLDRIMSPGQITTLLQPIFQQDGDRWKVVALEALSRGPAGTNLQPADVLFEYVRRKRKEDIVDLACLRSAAFHAAALSPHSDLFVNVHASSLSKSDSFVDGVEQICSAYAFTPSNLVVEVVEHSPYWNHHEFIQSTKRLRDLGVRIAVDDLGVAYSSFKVILDANPEFLKIDIYITRGCHRDHVRRSMIESFVFLGRSVGAQVIAEGIELKRDLDVLRSLGVSMFQGYMLGKPQPASQLKTTLKQLESSGGSLRDFSCESLAQCND